jgi:DNA-binding phage protein
MPRRKDSTARVLEGEGWVGVRMSRVQDALRSTDPPPEHHQDPPDPVILVLERVRRDRGVKVSDLAQQCGMKRQQLDRILKGTTPNPGIQTVRRVAAALGLDLCMVLSQTSP